MSRKIKFAAGLAATGCAIGLLAAAPAQAATTVSKDGCTVDAVRPTKVAGSVHFTLKITCNATQLVHIQIQGREHDVDNPSDLVGRTAQTVRVVRGETRTMRLVTACANTEVGFEELFSRARLAVADSNPEWSSWDRSVINGAICA